MCCSTVGVNQQVLASMCIYIYIYVYAYVYVHIYIYRREREFDKGFSLSREKLSAC